jgi:diguanylate cyclase (GGDEF)-like protein
MLNVALCQKGMEIEGKLKETLLADDPLFHHFQDLPSLLEFHRRLNIDLVIIGCGDNCGAELSAVEAAKMHPTLQLVPLVLYIRSPARETITRAYASGVDELLTGEWDRQMNQIRLQAAMSRSRRDLGVNPSSRLPGNSAIEADITRRLKGGERFAVCYADLDNFKAYNDYYGYSYGDKVIKMTAQIIRDTVRDLAPSGFVGHIGGDDFLFVVGIDRMEKVCKGILSTFDRLVATHYEQEDIERGHIEVQNRRGILEQFPILTLSIAVVKNDKKPFGHIGELSHMLADLKKYAKTLPGSNFVVERRKKY